MYFYSHYQTWDIYVLIGEPKSCSHFITNGAKLRLSYKYIHIPSLPIIHQFYAHFTQDLWLIFDLSWHAFNLSISFLYSRYKADYFQSSINAMHHEGEDNDGDNNVTTKMTPNKPTPSSSLPRLEQDYAIVSNPILSHRLIRRFTKDIPFLKSKPGMKIFMFFFKFLKKLSFSCFRLFQHSRVKSKHSVHSWWLCSLVKIPTKNSTIF
jgi:hypothetical protein